MHTLVTVLQIASALLLVVLMAVQTDKAEQGGVMGIGAAGGRSSSDIDVAVGPERILKPLTKWAGIGFLFASILGAVPADSINIIHVVVTLAIYLVVMLYGDIIWRTLLGTRR